MIGLIEPTTNDLPLPDQGCQRIYSVLPEPNIGLIRVRTDRLLDRPFPKTPGQSEQAPQASMQNRFLYGWVMFCPGGIVIHCQPSGVTMRAVNLIWPTW
jgi:hypothetical protein